MKKEKDFVLSEKIGGKVLPNDIGDLSVKDVKEFIRRLKEEVCNKWCGTNDGRYPECKFCKTINKLAGEEIDRDCDTWLKIAEEDVDKIIKSEQQKKYERILQKGIRLLKENPNAIIDILNVATKLTYLRGRLFEQTQQRKDNHIENIPKNKRGLGRSYGH